MQFIIKLLLTNAVIIACTQIGRKFPTLGGLIATMPLTSLLVLLWLYNDNPGESRLMVDYTRGVLWGIIPTVIFFVVALICFRREFPLPVTLSASFAAWLVGAAVHQWLLK
jgi:uncharacterized membrane protein (GlpM family)